MQVGKYGRCRIYRWGRKCIIICPGVEEFGKSWEINN